MIFSPYTLFAQPRIINGVSVPSDFPLLIPVVNIDPSPGRIFTSNTSGSSYYVMIFNNDGTPYYYKKVDHYSTDFKMQPNGLLTRYSPDDGGFIIINNNFETTAVISVQNDHGTDEHDFLITPDGTYLMIGITSEERDMSIVVDGGDPNANLIGNVIQELDAGQNVIFEWNASNYFDITDATEINLTASRIDWVHMNSITIDYDGHILVSSRHLSECTKINRQTGEIIWRLGGANNEFTFINEDLEFSFQHAFYPVDGTPGNYIIYDNGNHRGQFSRVVEYKITIDGDAKTAEKIWEFRYDPDFYAHRAGNAQRLSNGNTLINLEQPQYPKAVEITPEGEIVYEANLSPLHESHKTFKFEWEGTADRPYLLTEPLAGALRLIFNKFGDDDVAGYNIYGGPDPDPTTIIASTNEPWYDLDLRPYSNHSGFYFRITSVSSTNMESNYSNTKFVDLTQLFNGYSIGIIGHIPEPDVFDPDWTESQNGFASALYFDGVDDFINCGNDYSLQISGTEITLEAWININSFADPPDKGVILAKDYAEQDQFMGYLLSCNADGVVFFSIGNTNLYSVETNPNAVQLNQWYHVAATFDGINQRIYIDGILSAESNEINNNIGNASNVNLRIGSSPFNNIWSFHGTIDEVRIWNITRTQSEIQTTMNVELKPDFYSNAENGLIAYWQFNEGSGQTVEDLAIDNNLLLNGDFSFGENFWEFSTFNYAEAEASVNDESIYSVDINYGGISYSDVSINHNNIWLIQNNQYTLTFDAWSTEQKIFEIKIRKSSQPFTNYLRKGADQVTGNRESFEYNFTMTDLSDNEAELVFFIGGNNSNFYLDNVRLTTDISSSVLTDFENLNEFKIVGNYPNPFNPSTTIEYFLPELSEVKISAYDILGRLVKTIFNGIQNGGLRKIQFNGRNLCSGVYIYTIEANSLISGRKFRDSNKMLFLK
ncbi:LamG-like jellyroll fold domain-containing protein [Bacteroidota bacterium]